ncbi:hypothetical protein DFH08DRAFT_691821 [Mycena albidolilacea]|uniref:F-box domain-containing protein n=1 Tax=Mycena albidolilacea TaxID=1033008 RepID=A0AAD7EX19_9AGAR|nr:hypothetical protein DFH08DRAFT_691821 [Mycena albidolilacea]
MSLRVPPELTDRIIDFLWDCQLDLCACSLVCRQWLPASRCHIFETIAICPDSRLLALMQFPQSVVANHTRTLNFRLWLPDEIDIAAVRILRHLPNALNLRTVIVGAVPPSPAQFPVVPLVEKLSLQHTKFASYNDFAEFLLKFTTLRELELGWISWEDFDYDVQCSRVTPMLENLSIQGFEEAPDILQWLSSADYGPQTRGLTLYIPNKTDTTSLNIISRFLHRLNDDLQYLRLDMFPSPYLQCMPYFLL